MPDKRALYLPCCRKDKALRGHKLKIQKKRKVWSQAHNHSLPFCTPSTYTRNIIPLWIPLQAAKLEKAVALSEKQETRMAMRTAAVKKKFVLKSLY